MSNNKSRRRSMKAGWPSLKGLKEKATALHNATRTAADKHMEAAKNKFNEHVTDATKFYDENKNDLSKSEFGSAASPHTILMHKAAKDMVKAANGLGKAATGEVKRRSEALKLHVDRAEIVRKCMMNCKNVQVSSDTPAAKNGGRRTLRRRGGARRGGKSRKRNGKSRKHSGKSRKRSGKSRKHRGKSRKHRGKSRKHRR